MLCSWTKHFPFILNQTKVLVGNLRQTTITSRGIDTADGRCMLKAGTRDLVVGHKTRKGLSFLTRTSYLCKEGDDCPQACVFLAQYF